MTIRPMTLLRMEAAGLAAAIAVSGAARAETLSEAIAMAYQSNPTLLAQRAALRATDETYVQARAGYQPTASAQGSVTTDSNNIFQGGTPVGVGVTGTQTSAATVTLTQPLYTGGRVAGEVDAARATVMAGRESLRAAEQTLLLGVIQAYVAVRHDQQSLAIARENVTLLEHQQAEINARFKVGEITRTDVAQTRERVAAAQSQAASAEANLAISRASYLETVGQYPGELAPETPLERLLPKSAEEAERAAVIGNPQLRQADYGERASAARIAAARAQSRPSLSLQGSGGYSGGNLGPHTPFARYGHDLTASAVVTLPISTGGVTSSLIRQAVENNSVDRIGIESVRRQVVFAVSQSWDRLSGLHKSVVIDQGAVDDAKVAFEGSRQEGKLGLRSTLDVLIAEQDLYTAEISLADAQRDAYAAASDLLAATGLLRVEAFAPEVPRYSPERNFNRVSQAPIWTPWEPAVAALDRLGAPGEPRAVP